LLQGVDVGGVNRTLALSFLRQAAREGRASAMFMAAEDDRESGNCTRAFHAFAHLGTTRHPMVYSLYAHARRAHRLRDVEGAGLRLLLLAEAGSWTAAREAAELLGTLDGGWPCGGWRRCSLALRLRLGRSLDDADQLAAAGAALRADSGSTVSERSKAGGLLRAAAAKGSARGLWESSVWELCELGGNHTAAAEMLGRLWSGQGLRHDHHSAVHKITAVAGFLLTLTPEILRPTMCGFAENHWQSDFGNQGVLMQVIAGVISLVLLWLTWRAFRGRR